MPAGIMSLGVPSVPESRSETDVRLLNTWRNSYGLNKDRALKELLGNLQGAIGTAVSAFNGAPMPQVTVKLMAQQYALDALTDFNAGRGMSLSSYVTTIVKQKLFRYVSTYQNVARIPENKIRLIGPIRDATTDLTARFGHEPSAVQIADHLSVPLSHVTEVRRLLRKDLLEEGGGFENFEAFEHDPDFEKASLAYYGMAEVEKLIFDYSLGAHGQPQMSTNDIAKKLKLSAARISQIKKMVAEKIKPYIGGVM